MSMVSPADPALRDAAERLDRWFAACPRAAVAFSGGVDSALVAFWARRQLGRDRATAWTADSPSLKREDLAAAVAFCARHDIPLQVFATDELSNPEYASNPVNRCYFCKSTLYETLGRALPPAPDQWVCSGVNLDDQSDFRPSMQAAREARVRHPLLECSLDKATVRALARHHGLEVWDKPASPCMSSRIPYGQAVTREKLGQIEAAEGWLRQHGFPVSRVRHYGATAVVEVPPEQLEQLGPLEGELRTTLQRLGFAVVQIDREGFVSGKLNRAIGRGPAARATA